MMSKLKFKDVFKILVLGSPGAGKTTLIEKYSDKPVHGYIPKIGVNFFIKYINIDGHNYTIQFWDFFDEEKFGSLHSLYYKGASAIFYVIDLSKPETFEYHQNYLKKVRNEGKLSNCPVLLIGNKIDLVENEKELDRKKYFEFVRKEGLMGYIELSSIDNIDSLIKSIPNIIQSSLKKNYQVKFLVNSKEYNDIKRFAKVSHQTQSEFIRTAIWEKIRAMDPETMTKSLKVNSYIEESELRLNELKKIRELLEGLEKQKN